MSFTARDANLNVDGDTIYARLYGAKKVVAANSSEVISLVVPYDKVLFQGIEIIQNVTAQIDLTAHAPGDVAQLDKFGFDVCVGEKVYTHKTDYAATVIKDMILKCTVKNITNNEMVMGANFVIHEVVVQ